MLDENYDHFVKDEKILSSSIDGVYIGYYKNNITQLSEIMYRIIKNHPFNNGNKRTAIFSVFFHIIIHIVIDFENLISEKINKHNIEFIEKEGGKIYKKQFKKKMSKNQFKKNMKIFLKINENKIKVNDEIEIELIQSFLRDSEVHYKMALAIAFSSPRDKEKVVELIKMYITIVIKEFIEITNKFNEILVETMKKNAINFNPNSFAR